jgi:hypothetical protein
VCLDLLKLRENTERERCERGRVPSPCEEEPEVVNMVATAVAWVIQ